MLNTMVRKNKRKIFYFIFAFRTESGGSNRIEGNSNVEEENPKDEIIVVEKDPGSKSKRKASSKEKKSPKKHSSKEKKEKKSKRSQSYSRRSSSPGPRVDKRLIPRRTDDWVFPKQRKDDESEFSVHFYLKNVYFSPGRSLSEFLALVRDRVNKAARVELIQILEPVRGNLVTLSVGMKKDSEALDVLSRKRIIYLPAEKGGLQETSPHISKCFQTYLKNKKSHNGDKDSKKSPRRMNFRNSRSGSRGERNNDREKYRGNFNSSEERYNKITCCWNSA
jgi:hypothetical protein